MNRSGPAAPISLVAHEGTVPRNSSRSINHTAANAARDGPVSFRTSFRFQKANVGKKPNRGGRSRRPACFLRDASAFMISSERTSSLVLFAAKNRLDGILGVIQVWLCHVVARPARLSSACLPVPWSQPSRTRPQGAAGDRRLLGRHVVVLVDRLRFHAGVLAGNGPSQALRLNSCASLVKGQACRLCLQPSPR